MLSYELDHTEIELRRRLTARVQQMVQRCMVVEEQDDNSILTRYRDFVLQITFSELHPLMMFSLARSMPRSDLSLVDRCNEINLNGIFGTHALSPDGGCYHYRSSCWLDTELKPERFYEILDRCVDEAVKGYFMLSC